MDRIRCFELRAVGSIPAGPAMHKYLHRRFIIMITTTVVWPQNDLNAANPTPQEGAALAAFASTLLDGAESPLTSTVNDDGTETTSVRSWPTLEKANQWVEYVLANYNVTSAIVNPE